MNEKQKREAAALRAAIEKAGRGPNGQVAPAVKERVATWVAARVAEEIQQRTLASELGLHESTISSWLRARRTRGAAEAPRSSSAVIAKTPRAMVEVSVTRRSSRPRSRRSHPFVDGAGPDRVDGREFVLVAPSGVRIEGLDVASVVEILRGLR